MDNKKTSPSRKHLEERLAYLEEVNRSTMKALDTAAYFGNFQSSINKLHDPTRILSVTRDRLLSIIPFKTTAFFLVDEKDSDFVLFMCDPETDAALIQDEMDVLIDDGTFARALKEKKAVITHATGVKEEVLIHVLTTESRVRGMFVGILEQKSKTIKEASMVLLSIIMVHSANAIESFELYNSLRSVNKELEKKINQLVESEKELIKHREHLDGLVIDRTKELEEVNKRLKIELKEKQIAENALIKSRQELIDANKNLEFSIKHANKMAEEAMVANKAKTEFLAGMSHELRTPMNAVIGFSEVLLAKSFGPLNDKQEKYLINIHTGGKHLFNLINNILDYASLESGLITAKPGSVNIGMLLENLAKSFKLSMEKKEIELRLNLSKNINGIRIKGDEDRLIQAMEHVVANALKFTSRGGVITISSEKQNNHVLINVSDNGIGIPIPFQNRIFDLFFQIKGGMSDKTPGTGLGLALVKKIIDFHNGVIRVESKGENQGSTFRITLPID